MRNSKSFSRFLADSQGVAVVEFVFTLPLLLLFLGIAVAGGQGFAVSRKVEQAARTLTDLASQQSDISLASGSYTYKDLLNAAALVVAPFDSANMTVTLSEVKVDTSGSATYVWSQKFANGAISNDLATTSQTVSNLTAFKPTTGTQFVVIGTVTYKYLPFSVLGVMEPINFNNQLFMVPRQGANGVQCC